MNKLAYKAWSEDPTPEKKRFQGVINALSGLTAFVATAVILVAVVSIPVANLGAWITLAALLISVALTIRPNATKRHIVISIMAAVVVISAIDYLGWRVRLINMQGWWIGVPLFLAEAFGALHTIGLMYTIWPRREPLLVFRDNPAQFPIYVFIPTVNEGVSVVGPTLEGVLAAKARYLQANPKASINIVVCNDGFVANASCWQEIEQLCEEMGVMCVTRTVKGGAKAGNIENARKLVGATGKALIVIFDADQIAHPDFFLKTIPPFADPQIGWVQTGQYYSNLDNAVARWANDQQALFYRVLCPGKSKVNSAFICGTNVVLRAAALDEIGGLPQDSVTEDFAASIELHPRWRSIFLPDVLATGLGPMDLKSYFSQQRRWAIGTLGMVRSHWRHIWLPSRKDNLSFDQRIQYTLASTHYLCGLRDLIYVIAPLAFLVTGVPAVRGADLPAFLWHFLPYWIASQVAFWYVAQGRTTLRGIIIGFATFPILIGSLMTVITGKRIGFQVTAKQRVNNQNLWQIRTHGIFLLLCLAGLIWGLTLNDEPSAIFVSVMWVFYQIAMFLGVFWLALADSVTYPERIKAQRQRLAEAGRRMVQSPRSRPALQTAMFGTAIALVAGAVVLPSLQPEVQAYEPALQMEQPYFGLTVPYDLVDTRPGELESQLSRNFTIVGRTQEIQDNFDAEWANELHADGGTPWITLLFGVSGEENYKASLPSIANGLHDAGLRRWAREIRTYGHPVYLTILPHADRNWSLSSAVANGGIPQDVSRAWQRVQGIFAEEGAVNVAWVWAPADPMHDAEYAPPREMIDAVLLSLIKFPDTEWFEPADELNMLLANYPDKPLFIEVSVLGDPEAKAAYLHELGEALAQTPNVHAFVYKEGSPDPSATVEEHLMWSMASDTLSLEAMNEAASAVGIDRVQQVAAGLNE